MNELDMIRIPNPAEGVFVRGINPHHMQTTLVVAFVVDHFNC